MITLLYENEGLTQDLFHTFLIYVASSSRPAHELLDPNLIDLEQPYAREFEGMTRTPVPLDTLLATRQRLIAARRTIKVRIQIVALQIDRRCAIAARRQSEAVPSDTSRRGARLYGH